MPKIQFIGKVSPDTLKLSVPPIVFRYFDFEFGVWTNYRICIFQGIVNVECDSDFKSNDYMHTLIVKAFDYARTAANMVSFASGQGFSLTFEMVISEDGLPRQIVFSTPDVSGLCTAYDLDVSENSRKIFNDCLQLIMTTPPLSFILNDLVSTITTPHMLLINCGRAIDAMKHSIADAASSESKKWEQMRTALNVSQPYLKLISDSSAGPRHAKPGLTPAALNVHVLTRAWKVMDRFLHYMKGGRVELKAPEHPLLDN